jgi:hypothetical protein
MYLYKNHIQPFILLYHIHIIFYQYFKNSCFLFEETIFIIKVYNSKKLLICCYYLR